MNSKSDREKIFQLRIAYCYLWMVSRAFSVLAGPLLFVCTCKTLYVMFIASWLIQLWQHLLLQRRYAGIRVYSLQFSVSEKKQNI